MSIQYAFSRPTASPEEELALITNYVDIGYDGLQLKWSQYTPYLGKPQQFIERWGQPRGIGSALITGGTLIGEDSQQQLRNLYSFAKSIGTEIIVYCHAVSRTTVTNEDIKKFAKLFEQFGKEAEQEGLRLSLHHHYDQPLMYRDDFDIFFNQLKDNRAVGLTVDTAHLVKSGIHDIADVIRSFGGFIDNFHMKDFSNGDYKVLGHGEINFDPVFQAIRDIGYKGWVSADEESGGEIIGGMGECLSFMKKGLS